MNYKKALVAIAVLALLALAAVIIFFIFAKDSVPAGPLSAPSGPLFGNSQNANDLLGIDTTPRGGASSQIVALTSDERLISGCDSPVAAERNDCIKKAAVGSGRSSLCAAILGTFGQTDCMKSVQTKSEPVTDISTKAVVRYDFDYSSTTAKAEPLSSDISSRFSDLLSKIADGVREARDNPDPRYTAEGFLERLAKSSVALYSFSRLQALPGTELVARGLGFAKANNEIHIGNYSVSGLSSTDGMTLRFVLPGSMEYGTYEAWVTNEKGTSRSNNRPIQLTITDSPLDPPVITGVSPLIASLTDTVTLYGSGFRGAVGLYTSLGELKNIFATDSSITFKVSDFPIIAKIKDAKGVKGGLMQVSVIVGTPQGYNQEPFVFKVQF